MKIWYHRSPYISHFRAGQEYMECLALLGHELVDAPHGADLAVLHDEPINYPRLLEQMGSSRPKRVAGYAVWETQKLPQAFAAGLAAVDEVWTCSKFSKDALAPACAKIFVLPHVVRRIPLTPGELHEARKRLGIKTENFVFFSVVDVLNPRKNMETLLTAYGLVREIIGARAHMVVKQYRMSCPLPEMPGLSIIEDKLSDREMAALYAACDCYVSAHRAEAWGLSLSEAMAYGRLVIATGYSGNMQYMNKDNSIPIGYSLAPVSSAMVQRFPFFSEDMEWAEINMPDLVQAMVRASKGRKYTKVAANASKLSKEFGPEAIAMILQNILNNC